jgi:hypothetical protein
MATQEISDFTNLQGDNVGTFVDVLRGGSALAATVAATGGQVLPGLDFRDHKLPVVTRTTLPKKYAEGGTRTSAASATAAAALDVSIYEDWNPISVEMERNTDPAGLVGTVVNASAALFPLVFDIEYLGDIVGGASITAQEYDAADPIASLSAALANFDATTYAATGMILTRAGARKLGFALDTQKRLQSDIPGGIAALVPGPSALTLATGAQLGVASVMAIIGPFHAGVWGSNGSMTIELRPDATVDSQGPGTGMVQYALRSAMGYVNGIDITGDGTGFVTLIDAA